VEENHNNDGRSPHMKRVLAWWLICGWLAVTPKVFAASQIDSVTIGYSSFAGAYGPLWIAVEEQLGRKHGLELKKAGIVFKTNKQKSLTVLKNYMRGAADDILDDTYESTKAGTATVPTPSLEIIKTAAEILSYQYPQAKQTDPAAILNPSYVKKIEQSGFIASLYKK
jgi:hypothetical protein